MSCAGMTITNLIAAARKSGSILAELTLDFAIAQFRPSRSQNVYLAFAVNFCSLPACLNLATDPKLHFSRRFVLRRSFAGPDIHYRCGDLIRIDFVERRTASKRD